MRSCIAILLLSLPLGAHAQQYLFGVYLDDRRIGTHRFTVERDATSDAVRVTSKPISPSACFGYRCSAISTPRWRTGVTAVWNRSTPKPT